MDKRNLGQKSMMQEIKDIAERRRGDDQTVYLASTNFGARLTPDLVFDDRHKYFLLLTHPSANRLMQLSCYMGCSLEE